MSPGRPVAEVGRPSRMTPELFDAEFVRSRRPVVLRGLVSNWSARKWEFPRIAGRLPKRPFRATAVAPDSGLRVETWSLSGAEIEQRLTSDEVSRDPTAPRPDWLFDLLRDLPELVPELPPPCVNRGAKQYRMFLGRDTT